MDIIKKIVKILLAAFVLWIVAILTTLFASMVDIDFIWIIALIIDIALFLYLIIYILYTLSSKFRNYFDITIEKINSMKTTKRIKIFWVMYLTFLIIYFIVPLILQNYMGNNEMFLIYKRSIMIILALVFISLSILSIALNNEESKFFGILLVINNICKYICIGLIALLFIILKNNDKNSGGNQRRRFRCTKCGEVRYGTTGFFMKTSGCPRGREHNFIKE